MIKFRIFNQLGSIKELENEINKWTEEINEKDITIEDFRFNTGQYGITVIIKYKELIVERD